MVKGFDVVIGRLQSNGSVLAVGAATDGSLVVNTQMIGKSGTAAGYEERLPDVCDFEMEVSGYVGKELHERDMVAWAIRIGTEVWNGYGEVSQIRRQGGLNSPATYSMQVCGSGRLSSGTVIDNRWILATGSWRDAGVWIDTEFWKDS